MKEDKATKIIRALLQSPKGFVTGSAMARELSVSRVAIWGVMEKLREEGYEFDAIRNRGYRIRELPRELSAAYLNARLPFLAERNGIRVHNILDSTNNEAERLLADGQQAPLVVVTKQQTKGRGRLGRIWESPKEGNFYGSLAFRPRLNPSRMQPFTLWMGLTICRFLEEIGKLKPMLKWPNDIFCNGKKAVGILTEARMDADLIHELVLGIGINVSSAPKLKDIPPGGNQAVSLNEASGREISLNPFTVALLETLLEAYKVFHEDRYQEAFKRLWERYNLLQGKTIKARTGTAVITGMASHLRSDGALIVRHPAGETALVSGEVTLSP